MILISALRRSLNGETKERMSDSEDSNQMKDAGDAIGSVESIECPDAAPEDDLYEVLHNIFPSSPHDIYCSNSEENLPLPSQMADSGEHSSSYENLEFFSGTEENEDPVDKSSPKATSSKKIQCCSTKSIGVQCEPITYVSKGVQWEPVLMVSQSVQCLPVTQLAKEVQCSNTFKTQCEQSETVSLVTTGVQYEYPCVEEDIHKKQLNTSKQLPENVPLEESEGADCESDIHLTSQQCGSEDQESFTILADSITLPALQEELDVVNSSQSTVCTSSSLSRGSGVIFLEDEHEVELNSSQPVPSTSGVKCKRKRNHTNRVRKMKRSIKTKLYSSSIHEKHSEKRLPVEARTDRNQSINECVNSDDCDKLVSKSVQEKGANNVLKVLCSASQETSTSDKRVGEKIVIEESSDELLELMGNIENCLAQEDISKKKNGALEIITKDKQLQTASQEVIKSPCPQSNVNRDVATTSESQRSGGMNWFSSLACERFSSPESIGEDIFEELNEDCNKNLAPKVQSKFTKDVDGGFSFQRRKSDTVRKSIAQNLENDSRKPPEKRKKLEFDANNTNISASSENSARLVPYSDSGSETRCSDSDNEMPKKLLKKQQFCKTTPTKSKLSKTSIISISREPQKKKTSRVMNCDGESKSQFRSSGSSSESGRGKNRPAHASAQRRDSSASENSGVSGCVLKSTMRRVQRKKINKSSSGENIESEDSGESDIVLRKKQRRIRENKLKVSARVESKKSSPEHLSIWSSDEDTICSRASTVSCRLPVTRSPRRRGPPYSKKEREAMLSYVIDHKYYKLVKGKSIWERMEKEQVCFDRTWQSMKEHFVKRILPQIETFNLAPEITKRFVDVRR